MNGKTLKLGATVSMGSWGGQWNDETPIKWLVIRLESGRALLLSEKIVDCQPFETQRSYDSFRIWKDTHLRQWLNGRFYEHAFSETEKSQILPTEIVTQVDREGEVCKVEHTTDQVFLPSPEELSLVSPGAHQGVNLVRRREAVEWMVQDCAEEVLLSIGADKVTVALSYWLRARRDDFCSSCWPVCCMDRFGCDVIDDADPMDAYGVRPAMWIKIT